MHCIHARMIGEPCRDLERIVRMHAHPAGERAHSAQDQPAIEGRRNSAGRALNLTDALKNSRCLFRDNSTAHHIGMATEIFRCRMHDEIRAEIERALHDRRPGVVASAKRAGVMRDFRDDGDVGDFQKRIGWCFDPD